MSDMLLRRRVMMATKWEPNARLYISNGNNTVPNKTRIYCIGRVRYLSNGNTITKRLSGWWNISNLVIDPSQWIEFMCTHLVPQSYESGKYKITRVDVHSCDCTASQFWIDHMCGPTIIENCIVKLGSGAGRKVARYYSGKQSYKNVSYKYTDVGQRELFAIQYSSWFKIDNAWSINVFASDKDYYNTSFNTFLIQNCPTLTRIVLGGNGNYPHDGNETDEMKNMSVEGCPNLTSIRINTGIKSFPIDVFTAFINSLPQRESDNRGTLSIYKNFHRTNQDILNILAAKNWDYVAYS